MAGARTNATANATGNNPAHAVPTNAMNSPNSRSFYHADSNTQPPPDDAATLVVPPSDPPSRHNSKSNENLPMNPDLAWPKMRSARKEYFSEFWATFILVLIGDGAVAQVVLSNNSKGNWLTLGLGWGVGGMLGAYTGGHSGAHMNPAVSLAMCVYRRLSWRKLPMYVLAQFLGAMLAAFIIYGNYVSAINRMEGGQGIRTAPGYSETATAGIFATYPADFLNTAGQFFSEFVATGILVFCLFALLDDSNLGAGNLTPLGLFMIFLGIAVAFGWETGFAINPARDLGPRIVSSMVGYGRQPWTAGNCYFWVPVIAPLLGGTFGGFLYDLFLCLGDSPMNQPAMGLRRSRGAHHKTSPV